MTGLNLQIDGRARQEPIRALDQRAAGGHVDDGHSVARSDTGGNNPMFLDTGPWRSTAVWQTAGHRGVHRRVR